MTEENKPRPNANYKLSKPDGPNPAAEENLVFYYNRERRLEKAPQAVKDLYATKESHNRFNLLKPLVADKPRAMMFFSIIMVCAMLIFVTILNKTGGSYSLDGNNIVITGTRYEGATIAVLTKTVKKNSAQVYTGAVDIAVYPVTGAGGADSGEAKGDVNGDAGGDDTPVFYHRIFFSMEPVEEYRFAVPFDSPEQLVILQSERSTIHIKYKPE